MYIPIKYEYKILNYVSLKENDLERDLNFWGKSGWKYKDFKIESNRDTGILILERTRRNHGKQNKVYIESNSAGWQTKSKNNTGRKTRQEEELSINDPIVNGDCKHRDS